MLNLDHYDYELPRELIAQRPLPQRVDARLLVVDRSTASWEHLYVRDLPEVLQAGDALVLNDTRVIPARLVGYRTRTGGRWEGLYLEHDNQGFWKILSKTRGKLAAGETVTLCNRQHQDVAQLQMCTRLEEGLWAARPNSDVSAFDLLEQVGRVPLPPYIRDGEMIDADRQSYQTVFADNPGAVAAPTAGLHFTTDLLERLQTRGVHVCRITLHVGLGTFRPITATRLDEHQMHSEWCRLDAATVDRLSRARDAGGRVVAVGTTAVRTLETAASQGELRPWEGQTTLFIRPPYRFRAIDAMMTNFHLPLSTLLVLVRTFGGDDLISRAYDEAIREKYRFYSYGDAMLIL